MSKYWSDIADQHNVNVGGVKKLIPNLGNKSKNVFYCRNLQLYLSLVMKLIGIYTILKFEQ